MPESLIMESIAIIGTGIAGMACGYFLKDEYDVTFYEKNKTPGGHTNTITVDENGKPVFIDTGFMVYNEITYPNLTRFFKELKIPTKPTSMSFSVQYLPTGLEYCGTGVSGLFAQRRNIFNLRFIRLLSVIDRFNKESVEVLTNDRYQSYTIFEYAKEKGYGSDLLNQYLIPMSSAIWSTEPKLMLNFPAATLVRFFKNHGLLGLTTHYQWRTVHDGSRVYRDKVLSYFKWKLLLNSGVKKVDRANGKVLVEDANGSVKTYDKVIIASHADEALAMLNDPTETEGRLLKNFRYQKNKAALHTDEAVMPKTRRAWSSWNTRVDQQADGVFRPTTVYYMNSLQQVSDNKNYFVSINDPGLIEPSKILWSMEYDHPVFDGAAIQAQGELEKLNQNGSVFFCGSYFKYGFHEDALSSAIGVCRKLLGENFWN